MAMHPAPVSSAQGGADLPAADAVLAPGAFARLVRRLLGHGSFAVGAGLLGLIALMALLAPWFAPHDPYAQDLSARLIPPVFYAEGDWVHPLGTDGFGRDYLSRIIYGARISLLIGIGAAVVSGLIGATLGVLGGYFGGRVDMAVTFVIATRLSMPVVLVALAVVALVGGSLEVVILVLGLLLWDRFAVVARSATMQVRAQDYVTAAQALGCSTSRILLTEVLPNILNGVIVVVTFEVAHAIVLEAALSFLGLGVQPPQPSWGLMIAEARSFMFFDFWLIAIPGVALFLLVLAVNLLGDGLRDVTAPEDRG